jgi:tRNA-specific 2-thiouridylase
MNYLSISRPDAPIAVLAKTRYRRPEVEGVLAPLEGDLAVLEFSEPQEPVAPGQSVVMYDGDVVLCGGIACR